MHPGGMAATTRLVPHLPSRQGSRIVDVGCGTGASLVHLAGLVRANLTGVDTSPVMLRASRQRVGFCRLRARVSLVRIGLDGQLPFADASVDAAYAESVLAIVDASVLPELTAEVARVLKPGGTFLVQDAIWMAGVDRSRIESVNRACLDTYGVIQSSAGPAYVDEWNALFADAGFEIRSSGLLDLSAGAGDARATRCSSVYSWYREWRARLVPSSLAAMLRYRRLMRGQRWDEGAMLEPRLFVLGKPGFLA